MSDRANSLGTRPSAKPVEIVIACHSPERRIDRAVRSVLIDNAEHAAVIVVCHNVDREVIAQRIPEEIRDQVRFSELHDGIPSPAGPFAHGMALANAQWVGIMGSDDVYEPGAVEAMLRLSAGKDAVIPALSHDDGAPVRTPPVRPGRRSVRDAVRDRLYYRSAPLGLIRRQFLREHEELGFEAGLRVGEDLLLSTLLWTRGVISVQRSGPGYVIGSDAADRVTMQLAPIAEELRHVSSIWSQSVLSQFTLREREALGTKYLRIHIFGAAYYRARQRAWLPGDRDALASAASQVLEAAPACAHPLSRADRSLLDAILDPSVPDVEINSRAEARRRFGRPATLLPRSLAYVFHREAPPRFMVASALVRKRLGRGTQTG